MWYGHFRNRHDHEGGPRGGWGGGRHGGASAWGFEMHGEGGGRGGRGRMFDGGELRLVLLRLIADEPRHGYDLIRTIEDLTGGAYAPSPGVVYPTLTLFDEQGLIEEQRSEGAKKRFAVTEAGRQLLADNAELVEELLARLRSIGGEREQQGASPVWRAVRNLGMAIRSRQSRGGFSDERLHDIAALIDEVAQKIERLR